MHQSRYSCFLLVLAFSFSGQLTIHAQMNSKFINNYEPKNYVFVGSNFMVSNLESANEKSLINVPKELQKDVAKSFEKRTGYLIALLTNENFISEPEVNEYFQSILNELIESNSFLVLPEIRIFLARFSWPNASNYGEGTIVFNAGLLNRVESEAQIAFILAHELAHQHLQHVQNGAIEHAKKINDKELQKKLKAISKQEYGSTKAALALYEDFVYDSRKHSREFEEEADSLAFEMLRNTKYDYQSAISSLKLLDTLDKEKYPEEIHYDQLFDSDTYDPTIVEDVGITLFGFSEAAEKEIHDSLKTHPDCLERIESIEKLISSGKVGTGKNQTLVDSVFLRDLIDALDFEIIQFYMDVENIDLAFYNSVKLLRFYPNNAYLRATIGACLYKIHEAKTAHKLGTIVQQKHPGMSKDFKNTLNLLNGLRLSQIKPLAWDFMNSSDKYDSQNEKYLVIKIRLAKDLGFNEDFSVLKTSYEQHYPTGKYKQIIHNL